MAYLLTPVPTGNLNGDEWVDVFDLGMVSEHWKETGPRGMPGDTNLDGVVNIFDVAVVSENWNPSTGGAAAVPEPSALILAGAASLCLSVLGHRRAAFGRSPRGARTSA